MLYLDVALISASITGFENPTIPYLDKTICLDEILVHSPSSMRVVNSPNRLISRGIQKGDWLIINSSLIPSGDDVILVSIDDTWGVSNLHQVEKIADGREVNVVGVVQQSVHFYRNAPTVPEHETLKDISLHRTLVELEYATVLTKASGESMLPFVRSGDLLIVERHLNRETDDVCVFALNGDLVLKRYNPLTGALTSDNPTFMPTRLNSCDQISHEGVVNKVIQMHRLICSA
ncbi:Error-prone repair protein UmuD [Vibrio chagasii]|nr:Error-prone repair protein UmuD [Vibrio chagasii]